MSDSRNHLEGTFEFPETKGEIKDDKNENISHSHHSSISSNQHIVVPVGSMKRPLSNYSAHTRTYAS